MSRPTPGSGGGHSGTNVVDLEVLRQITSLLGTAVNELDELGESMPETVHAGPYAKEVAELMNGVLLHHIELIVRMRMAAFMVLNDYVVYANKQRRQLNMIDELGKQMDELWGEQG